MRSRLLFVVCGLLFVVHFWLRRVDRLRPVIFFARLLRVGVPRIQHLSRQLRETTSLAALFENRIEVIAVRTSRPHVGRPPERRRDNTTRAAERLIAAAAERRHFVLQRKQHRNVAHLVRVDRSGHALRPDLHERIAVLARADPTPAWRSRAFSFTAATRVRSPRSFHNRNRAASRSWTFTAST